MPGKSQGAGADGPADPTARIPGHPAVVSAVFADRVDAQQAVRWLQATGVPDEAISVASRQGDDESAPSGAADSRRDGPDDDRTGARQVAGGACHRQWTPGDSEIAASLRTFGGLPTRTIAQPHDSFGGTRTGGPYGYPILTAGALASLPGTSDAAGVREGLAAALCRWGVSEAEAVYYAAEVERGSTYVGVELDEAGLSREMVEDGFRYLRGEVRYSEGDRRSADADQQAA